MSTNHPQQADNEPDTEKQRRQSALRDDTTGQASLIDFQQSVIILVVAFSVFGVAQLLLLNGAITDLPTNEKAAERGAATLAEDHLVTNPTSVTLDRDCAADFFAERTSATTGRCGFPGHWADGDGDYLNDATGIDGRTVNATVYDSDGNVVVANGVRFALGPNVPNNAETSSWERRRSGNIDTTPEEEWLTIRFTVWG